MLSVHSVMEPLHVYMYSHCCKISRAFLLSESALSPVSISLSIPSSQRHHSAFCLWVWVCGQQDHSGWGTCALMAAPSASIVLWIHVHLLTTACVKYSFSHFFKKCVCVCAHTCACIWVYVLPLHAGKKCVGSLGTGVTSRCELPDRGARNWIQVPCNCRMLSQLSSPKCPPYF